MNSPFTIRHSLFFIAVFLLLTGLSSPAQNPRNSSALVDDTISLYPGFADTVNILANDNIAPGDSIKRVIVSGGNIHLITRHTGPMYDGSFEFSVPFFGQLTFDTLSYTVFFKDNTSLIAKIFIRNHDYSSAFLDTNNVKALFHADGSHFFRENSEYYIPKLTKHTTVFSSTVWIGGKDEQGQLRLAAQRYGQGPNISEPHTHFDFYAGPVMDSVNYSAAQDTTWNRIWIIRKDQIEEYKANWWNPAYQIPDDILTWPGNGNTTLGQAAKLAPFYDMNGDGIYDPLHGDCPEVRGDEALYFIFNDDRDEHTESQGEKMKIEIHGMAYAFDLPSDSAMKNTIFVQYRIYNRSQHTYDSTFFSIFTDIDLGYAMDDYIGCDVERNLYFIYNGKAVDGSGQPAAYGANPPAQGVLMLSGPLMDADGIDNPRYDSLGNQLCDYSVNGRYFDDDIVDNERLGMTGFKYTNNLGIPYYMQDPRYAEEYYRIMSKPDSVRFILGTPTDLTFWFFYPGMSDSTNWGTQCTPVYNNWTEETSSDAPGDRRGVGVYGPFTFHPGDVQEIDFAYVWARDYVNPNPASVEKLRQMADQIKEAFESNHLSNGQQFYAVDDLKNQKKDLKLYPNPATSHMVIDLTGEKQLSDLQIINTHGSVVLQKKDVGGKVSVNISDLPRGIYLVKVKTRSDILTTKFIKK